MHSQSTKTLVTRFMVVVLFSIAFAYIESAVVVYLRLIMHPTGFDFPLNSISVTDPILRPVLLPEIGREAATLVLIFTGAWLAGANTPQRIAYFLTIFAVWDIFYYVWLHVLIGWPASVMDWDILFLIPTTWASAVLYPVLVACMMLVFAVVVLWRDHAGRPIRPTAMDQLMLVAAAVVLIFSFTTAGPYVTQPGYASHFHWPIFAAGLVLAILAFARCLLRQA